MWPTMKVGMECMPRAWCRSRKSRNFATSDSSMVSGVGMKSGQ
jgi:hypothetical protein